MSNDSPILPVPTVPSITPDEEDLYCFDCGYNLRGLPGMTRTCPECGHRNELDQSRVGSEIVARMQRQLRNRAGGSILALMFLLLCVYITILAWHPVGLLAVAVTCDIWLSTTFPTADGQENHRDVVRCGLAVLAYQLSFAFLCAIVVVFFIVWSWDSRGLDYIKPVYLTLCSVAVRGLCVVAGVLVFVYVVMPAKRALAPHLDGAGRRMAERWHSQQLRTPPEKR